MHRSRLPATTRLLAAAACLMLVPAALPADSPDTKGLPAQVQDFEKKLPEMTIKEAVINVSPKMRLYLPSGSFDLALKQEYRKTAVEFLSRYDFVNNSMGFNVDFLYKLLPLSFGVDLNDSVNFSEILADREYLQRSQFISPYARYYLGYQTNLRAGVRFENTYTAAVENQVRIDQGRNMLGEISLWRDTLAEAQAYPEGARAALSLQHSFKNLGSDYDYTQAEFNLQAFVYPFVRQCIEYRCQTGYPVRLDSRPLTSAYTAGGYLLLRGYRYKEFRGNAVIYNTLVYNVPIIKIDRTNGNEPNLYIVSWNFFIEAAKIGEKEIFTTAAGGVKSSAGMGIGYRIVLFNLFPIQVELSGAKAFEDRAPLAYFTISTIYYTWQPK